MAITGKLNVINDSAKFFLEILNADAPTSGFVPLVGNPSYSVQLVALQPNPLPEFPPIPLDLLTAKFNTADASFTFDELPQGIVDLGIQVALTVKFLGQTFYRSQPFSYARALVGNLNIYITHPPGAVTVNAGFVSKQISGASSSLPGNSTLTIEPWGFWVAGSESGADIQFGTQLIPNVSSNLGLFADISLNGFNINVGFPADCKESAHDIHLQIQAALQNAQSPLNSAIKTLITNNFAQQLGVFGNQAGTEAVELFQLLSVTFSTIQFAKSFKWALSDTGNTTPVIFIQPTIGFPRGWI